MGCSLRHVMWWAYCVLAGHLEEFMESEINRIYQDFENCASVMFAHKQLREGLMSSPEHARYILQVWEEHKRLSQNVEITQAFPMDF